ncbi:hypothetical protein MycrhDRAFT_1059 [Mycolicibacterium rhodesiae JS60]|nr:hypothetical protein MycrhDRAFT_1059 [Mycolicibacterium rhodesiae JS60]
MSLVSKMTGMACVVTAAISSVAVSPLVQADVSNLELHGTFAAFSDGQNARTNDRFHDEASVTSTWTIDSVCQNFLDCSGRVVSDQGWTADLKRTAGVWRASHVVADWEKCADGTTVAGEQVFTFFPDPAKPSRFIGWDKTLGPSGACGKNAWLVIEMPFVLTPAT